MYHERPKEREETFKREDREWYSVQKIDLKANKEDFETYGDIRIEIEEVTESLAQLVKKGKTKIDNQPWSCQQPSD